MSHIWASLRWTRDYIEPGPTLCHQTPQPQPHVKDTSDIEFGVTDKPPCRDPAYDRTGLVQAMRIILKIFFAISNPSCEGVFAKVKPE